MRKINHFLKNAALGLLAAALSAAAANAVPYPGVVVSTQTAGTIPAYLTDTGVLQSNDWSMETGMAKDINGFFYVAGSFSDGGMSRPFARKFSPAGTEVWTSTVANTVNPASYYDYGRGVAVSTDGSAVYLLSVMDSRGVVVTRLDAAGNKVWESAYSSGAGDNAYGIVADPLSGFVYVAGTSAGKVAIFRFAAANGATPAPTTFDGSAYNDVAYSIAQNLDYLAVAGSIDGGSGYNNNIWVAKFAKTSMNMVWASTFTSPSAYDGDDQAHAVKMDGIGNVYAAGFYYSDVSGADIWMGKYDVNGNLMFWKSKNGPANGWDKGFGLDLDPFGNIYVAGKVEAYNIGQGNNAWVGKYAPNGTLLSEITANIGDDVAYDVKASSAQVLLEAGFDNNLGVMNISPDQFGAPQELFASPGYYAAAVDLSWISPPVSAYDYSIQYSTYAAGMPWNRAGAQISSGAVTAAGGQFQASVLGLTTQMDYTSTAGNNVGPTYYFKVWISTGGAVPVWYALSNVAASAPGVPYNYWNDIYNGMDSFRIFQSAYGPSSAMTMDALGNRYVAYGDNVGDKQGFALTKFDSSGQPLWTTFYNDTTANGLYTPYRIKLGTTGHIYVVGHARIPDSNPDDDAWIAKFHRDGHPLWSKTFAGYPGEYDFFGDMAMDGAGNIYAGGRIALGPSVGQPPDAVPYSAMLLAKFDQAAGAVISSTTYRSPTMPAGTAPAAIQTVGLDASGNVIAGGYFGYINGTAVDQDAALVKFNNALSPVTEKRYVNAPAGANIYSKDTISAIGVGAGGIYAVGSKFTHGAGNYSNFWVADISPADFSEVWSSTYNSVDNLNSEAYGLNLSSGYLYAVGYEDRPFTPDVQKNIVLRKFDAAAMSSGPVWTKTADGAYTNDSATGLGVEIGPDGYFYVNGVFGIYGPLKKGNPGVAKLSEPMTGIRADMGPKPCSVQLSWITDAEIPQGTTFYVQYATYPLNAFSLAAAGYSFSADFYSGPGGYISHLVPGLEAGNGVPVPGSDNMDSPKYYFRMAYSTAPGAALVEINASTDAVASTPMTWDMYNQYPNNTKMFLIYGAHGGKFPLIRDAAGNVYVAGTLSQWGPGSSAAYVRKFSYGGQPLWTRYYSDGYQNSMPVFNGLALDASGYLYAAGTAGSDGNDYNGNPESQTKKDALLVKYAPDGRMQWAKTYDLLAGNHANDEVFSLAAGPAGLYAAGRTVDNNPVSPGYATFDAVVAKFGFNGALLSTATYASGNEWFNAVAYDPASALVYAAGTVFTGNASNAIMKAYGAAALAAQGLVIQVDKGAADEFYAVAVDTYVSPGIYLAGDVSMPSDGQDAYLAKYSTGVVFASQVWERTYNSANQNEEDAYGLALDSLGGVYVAGSEFRYDLNQGENVFLRKYNSDGDLIWTNTLNTGGNNDDETGALALDRFGSLFVAVNVTQPAAAYGGSGSMDGAGFLKYPQLSLNVVNPRLTVRVNKGPAGGPLAGVSVAAMGFSQTGGIDPNGIHLGVTDSSGAVTMSVPGGKSYFVAVSSHNMVPSIKDQLSDPGGNFFVDLNADTTKQYYISPRSTTTAGAVHRMTLNLSGLVAGEYVMGEVFINQTGERVGYGVIRATDTAGTMQVYNLPPASDGVYGMAVSIPSRNKVLQIFMTGAFPATASYDADMSAATQLTGSFDVGGSTVPPTLTGLVTDLNYSPLDGARVRLERIVCSGVPPNSTCNPAFSKETLTDAGGRYAFYNVPYVTCTGVINFDGSCSNGNENYSLNVGKAGYESGYGGMAIEAPPPGTVPAPLMRDFSLNLATYTLTGVLKYNGMPMPNATIFVNPDWQTYSQGADSYRYSAWGGSLGIRSDAKVRTKADGSFVVTGLTDGNARLDADFVGGRRSLNEGNNYSTMDDNVRVVISSQGATAPSQPAGNPCRPGRVWVLDNLGRCQSANNIAFNIVPQNSNSAGRLWGQVTFITTYTVTADNPLVISTSSPLTIMAQQECNNGNCGNQQMGFASLAGTLVTNTTTYSIVLSTGFSYRPIIFSTAWGKASSFDSAFDLASTDTVRQDLQVVKSGGLHGMLKMPDGTSFKPSGSSYYADIQINGVNVDVSDGKGLDEYGEFEFPNIAPGIYDLTLRSYGTSFTWALSGSPEVTVTAGKTTEVQLQLEDGLAVQPQIFGLPDISTSSWNYVIVGVPSGTEMNQKTVTELFFEKDVDNVFEYSTSTGWSTKYMAPGQYDFYLMEASRYNPGDGGGGGGSPVSYTQFGNFIGRVKGVAVQRSETNPNVGTAAQPIAVNILGSVGQERISGTVHGAKVFTDADMDRFFDNFNELFPLIPAVMLYDSAGDLRGFTNGLPSGTDFPQFWSALQGRDKAAMHSYLESHPLSYGVWGMPPGRYTAVFANPNYPPVAKEISLPGNSDYAFDFDVQDVVTAGISGVVKSSSTGAALEGARVYLKHRTVEKFTLTDSSGAFSFSSLPVGIYRMEVTRNGYVTSGVKTSLAANDSRSFAMYLLPSDSKITGRIFLSKFPTQLTKSGVRVVSYDETYNVDHPTDYLPKTEVQTDGSGNFEITGAVPGHIYKVSVFYEGKLPEVTEVTAEDGTTAMSDITLKDIPPQITIKVRRSADSVNKVDVTIKSPKQLITAPSCSYNPGQSYDPSSAVTLALVPGPNRTYLGQFTVSSSQQYYTVKVTAGDGGSKMEKEFVYDQVSNAKTEQYIQQESLAGGEIQMDKETEEYSGLELDPGALSYSTTTETTDYSNLVGGFFSALPSVRTVKTDKGSLTISDAIQGLMASEVYNMDLSNASANKPFTLTLKYDKEKGAGASQALRIYQYDAASGSWKEVPGNYTTDPMLGVLSVDVASLSNATEGIGGVTTPLGRKRFGMSAVVNGRYVPSAAGTSQSGRFAVFTANPPTGTAAYSSAYEVVNLPNPFNLKSKNVTLSSDVGGSGIANPYPTEGTVIKYNLPAGKSGGLKFVIYDLAGEKVRTIDEGTRAGGQIYYSEWDGRNDNNQKCASGVYFMLTYLDGKKLGTRAHKMAIIK